MLRSAPLQRRTRLRAGSKPLRQAQLIRHSRLPAVNRRRRERDEPEVKGSPERRAFLRSEPCYVCTWLGRPGRDPVEASHYPSVGAGGGKRDQFPCCFHHHRGDEGSHVLGVPRFEARFGLVLEDLTARFSLRYEQDRAGVPLAPLLRRPRPAPLYPTPQGEIAAGAGAGAGEMEDSGR